MKSNYKIALTISLILGIALPTTVVGAFALTNSNNIVSGVQKQYLISFNSNGGSSVSPIIYVNGDDSINMPKSNKYGFSFSGWYLDNNTFEKPFYPGSTIIDENITLYAKWTIKSVKVYLDTDNPNEFEPLIYNVGDTFHVSSLPTVVKDKVANGINFGFETWKGMDDKPITQDFIIRDTYYAFYASYGLPKLANYKEVYSSDFSTDYGYIDPNHSWSRGETNLPAAGIGQGAPNQDIYLRNGNLVLRQLTHNAQGYGAKALLPHEYTNNLRKYGVETTFRISKQSGLSGDTLGANDVGFGIMVGYDKNTGANVEAVVDPGNRCVRISGTNNAYAKSSTDVNSKFKYILPTSVNLSDYHTLLVMYNGETPSTSSSYNASYIEVYFDNVLCWSTKTTTLNKNWFFEGQARGYYTGLCASLCEAEVKSVTLHDFEYENVLYSYDFSTKNNTFADGWRFMEGSNGCSIGEFFVKNGELNINTYFKNQSILKHQIIYSPADELTNFISEFDFKFNQVSAVDKYMGFVFNGQDDGKFNAIFARQGNGQIQLYKHGETSSAYNSWSTATGIKTVTGGFSNIYHHMMIVKKDLYLLIYLDGEEICSQEITSSKLYEKGYIGFLTSAADASFDNFYVYDLDKEVA